MTRKDQSDAGDRFSWATTVGVRLRSTSGNLTRYTDARRPGAAIPIRLHGNVTSETWYANATDAAAGKNARTRSSITRDSAGRITSESDNYSADTYAYNDAGQITSTTETQPRRADRGADLPIRHGRRAHADGGHHRRHGRLRGRLHL